MTIPRLIVGLGNPGEGYEKTRHNVGRWWIDLIATQYALHFSKVTACSGLLAKCKIGDQTRYFLYPTTYMNESGRAVQQTLAYFSLPPASLFVVQDELDLEPGMLRLKQGGGAGGHKGITSIYQRTQYHDFMRLRIGVGRPRGATDRYVLGTPPLSEQQKIKQVIQDSMVHLDLILAGQYQTAMNYLHEHKE